MLDEANHGQAKRRASRRRNVGPVSGAKAITAEQRAQRAIELRLQGHSLQAVADELGYATPSGAFRAVIRGLKADLPDAERNELRTLEAARLDALMAAHWLRATRGLNDKSSAIVLRCINQRARLLGLDAPARVDVNLQDGEMVEVGVLQVLDEEHMEMALKLRDQVAALSRLRAGGRIS